MIASMVLLWTSVALEDYPTGRYHCEEVQNSPVTGRPFLHAELEEDLTGTLIKENLTVQMNGYQATFNLLDFHAGEPIPLQSIQLETWAAPLAAIYPVTVKVSVAGALVSTQTFAHPNIMRFDFTERQLRPELQFDLITTSARLFGASGVEFVATDKVGSRLAKLLLPSPDWKSVAAFSAASVMKLHDNRRQGRCVERVITVVS